MKIKKTVAGGLIIAIAVGGLVLTHHNGDSKASNKNTSQINLASNQEIGTLDVSKINDGNSSQQMLEVGEGLYRIGNHDKLQNALANKTQISRGGKQYVIQIKKNARWSNGDPVTAQNFVYSWRRTVTPSTASEFSYEFANIKNATAISAGKMNPDKLGVKADGKYELSIALSQPTNNFKKILSSTNFYPLDERAVNKYGKKYGTSAKTTVYNGPFTMEGWTGSNDSWTLKKNPYYYGKNDVKLNKINYQVIKDPSTGYNLYQMKKLDMLSLSGEQNKQLGNSKDAVNRPQARTAFIQYNRKIDVLKNVNILKAISLAIDRTELTRDILQNGSKPATGFSTTGMATNPKTGKDFTQDSFVKDTTNYNPELAKKLFAKGLKETDKHNVSLQLLTDDSPADKQVVEFIQSQVQKNLPAFKITLKLMPFNTMLSTISKGNFEMNLTGWGADYADPVESLKILTSDSNSNMGHFHNAEFDNAIKNAENRDALNRDNRYQDLVTANKIAMEEQAITPLYQDSSKSLVNPNLKGVVYDQVSGSYDFIHARLVK